MPVHKCPNGKYRIGSGKCMYDSKEKAESAYKAYLAKKHTNTKNETDYDREVDSLKRQVQKELDDLFDISSVLTSLKEILNFKRTGKVYPDEGVLSAK